MLDCTLTADEREALTWLFSFADQERGVGWNPSASLDEQWKVGRTRALLDVAGAPDRGMTCVLVAGTKGKGSTAAFLASILSAAGIRAGLAAKPHLQSYRERIRIDGAAISPDEFAGAVRRWQGLVAEFRQFHPDAGEPTTFEVTTALAADHFARNGCKIAIFEVGLGGRLDATNAVAPALSIVTPISYDHTAILGRTLGQIATEKAGIIRAGHPALVAASQRPSALRTLRTACRRIGATCDVVSPLQSASIKLIGAHQRQNAGLAVAAARHLVPSIDEDAIELGLSQLRWPGRFEVVESHPRLVLDGAHNDASASALADTLRAETGGTPVTLVIGINQDKDARALLRPLMPLADRVIATCSGRTLRALPAHELASLIGRQRHGVQVEAIPDLGLAVQAARGATKDDGWVCVTGSLAVVGEAREALGLPIPEHLW